MGRDIYVDSKHFSYYGSKSSDLIMAFDRFFWKFPHYTKEYFGENVAHGVLNDLAIDGFKRVDKLYAYEPG